MSGAEEPDAPKRLTVALHLRLTAIFAGVFVLAGAALLAVNYSLLSARLPHAVDVVAQTLNPAGPAGSDAARPSESGSSPVGANPTVVVTIPPELLVEAEPPPGDSRVTPGAGTGADRASSTQEERSIGAFADTVSGASVQAYRDEVLAQLLQKSLAALAAVGLIAAGVGWWLTRRLLQPVRDITRAAQRLGDAGSLNERLVVGGPRDELRELGETFNAMLDRLQVAFGRDRQMMANVSHELRSPLANQRMVLEVGLADETASASQLRGMGQTALGQNLRTQRIVERMLVLASAQDASPHDSETIDLAECVRDCLRDEGARAESAGLEVHRDLEAAPVIGDRVLLDRLVANLVENAIKYNEPHGWIRTRTGPSPDGALGVLEVSNSGPVVLADDASRLLEPFRRQRGDRVRSDQGVGLGLAIATAIVHRHAGTIDLRARDGGGLLVRVSLPARRSAVE